MNCRARLYCLAIVLLVLLLGAAEAGAQMPGPPPPPPGPGRDMFYVRTFRLEDNKVVTGAPYSAQATTDNTQALSDGNRIERKETAKVYRDSLGRTRREMTVSAIGPWSSGTPTQIISISDPAAGVNYMLNVQQKKAYKMPPPPKPPAGPGGVQEMGSAMTTSRIFVAGGGMGMAAAGGPGVAFVEKDAALGNRTQVSLGTQEIAGVVAQGTKTTETIPAGKIGNEKPIVITTERWYSPDLQTDVLVKHSDPRMGEVTYQLTDISREEPDASLFQVPPDYTVEEGPMVIKKQLH